MLDNGQDLQLQCQKSCNGQQICLRHATKVVKLFYSPVLTKPIERSCLKMDDKKDLKINVSIKDALVKLLKSEAMGPGPI